MTASASSRPITIVWFRNDLRLADNPALHAAARRGRVIPVFIWSPEEEGSWPLGAASKWWLHRSLEKLGAQLQALGVPFILRQGSAAKALQTLIHETGADRVHWNRRYEPFALQTEAQVKTALEQSGIQVETFNGSLLVEPWAIRNKSGKPFQVFTPFWRTCLSSLRPEKPLPAPRTLVGSTRPPQSIPLQSLQLQPVIPWDDGLRQAWQPGEASAKASLKRFLAHGFSNYNTGRNRPGLPGTSRLSPHLHFGEISPRQVVHSLRQWCEKHEGGQRLWRTSQFLTELGWREFGHHLLYHFPQTPAQPLRPEFARFPWQRNPEGLKAWQGGRTGFPLVDAGMRQLWKTGWMHNRVRMVVASFLVKDLLIPWQTGAAWFWDTLVDANLANNTLGWQWTAGCGADASPFFRVFNPVSQGRKFDPEGDYVRHWVPELAGLPGRWIHEPWAAPREILQKAGVALGQTYPSPILQHSIAREVALEGYKKMKISSSGTTG